MVLNISEPDSLFKYIQLKCFSQKRLFCFRLLINYLFKKTPIQENAALLIAMKNCRFCYLQLFLVKNQNNNQYSISIINISLVCESHKTNTHRRRVFPIRQYNCSFCIVNLSIWYKLRGTVLCCQSIVQALWLFI